MITNQMKAKPKGKLTILSQLILTPPVTLTRLTKNPSRKQPPGKPYERDWIGYKLVVLALSTHLDLLAILWKEDLVVQIQD